MTHGHSWRHANPDLCRHVAALIRGIFDAPHDEWRQRAHDLADALDDLANESRSHP